MKLSLELQQTPVESKAEITAEAKRFLEARYGRLTFTNLHKRVMPLCDIPNTVADFWEHMKAEGKL